MKEFTMSRMFDLIKLSQVGFRISSSARHQESHGLTKPRHHVSNLNVSNQFQQTFQRISLWNKEFQLRQCFFWFIFSSPVFFLNPKTWRFTFYGAPSSAFALRWSCERDVEPHRHLRFSRFEFPFFAQKFKKNKTHQTNQMGNILRFKRFGFCGYRWYCSYGSHVTVMSSASIKNNQSQ